ncbi:MAG TPA: hypothetical protein VMZ91_16640 [Candidatus Paceibacterota bacterium]|nr:hypothetical protein [Candidatus Paceibacterota bacterium]
MAICENCKKYPLEYRETNKAQTEKGKHIFLCDSCYKQYFKGKLKI